MNCDFMGLFDKFKRKKQKNIGVNNQLNDDMSFEEKLNVYLDGLSRKKAEKKADELKRQINEEEFLSNVQIFGIDISKTIEDAYKDKLYQIIDDMVIEKYGTDEEILKMNKRKEQEKIEMEEQKRLDELEKQRYLEEEALLNIVVDNNLNGKKLEEIGKVDEAQALYEENIRLGTDTPFPYGRLANIYHNKCDFESERNVLKLAIERCCDSPQVNDNYKKGFKESFENVESFLNSGKWKYDCLPPDNIKIYDEVKEAKRVLKEENNEKGIEMLEEIMEKGTFNNTVYNTLYQTYKKDKRFDDCIRVCEKAIDVLGLFSNDRKERWTINLEKVTKQKEKNE